MSASNGKQITRFNTQQNNAAVAPPAATTGGWNGIPPGQQPVQAGGWSQQAPQQAANPPQSQDTSGANAAGYSPAGAQQYSNGNQNQNQQSVAPYGGTPGYGGNYNPGQGPQAPPNGQGQAPPPSAQHANTGGWAGYAPQQPQDPSQQYNQNPHQQQQQQQQHQHQQHQHQQPPVQQPPQWQGNNNNPNYPGAVAQSGHTQGTPQYGMGGAPIPTWNGNTAGGNGQMAHTQQFHHQQQYNGQNNGPQNNMAHSQMVYPHQHQHQHQPPMNPYQQPQQQWPQQQPPPPPAQMPDILFYESNKPFYAFTNFYVAPFELDGKMWATSEHYFQANKFHCQAIRELIRRAPTARWTFTLARDHYEEHKRPDWEYQKETIMARALQAKFTQHVDLWDMLWNTGNARLLEDSPHDAYWGIGRDGKGLNKLGIALMELRSKMHQGQLRRPNPGPVPQVNPGEILSEQVIRDNVLPLMQGEGGYLYSPFMLFVQSAKVPHTKHFPGPQQPK